MWCLAWFSICASAVWHALLPVVHLTTGELKPRSVFISENALLRGQVRLGFGTSQAGFAYALRDDYHATVGADAGEGVQWVARQLAAEGMAPELLNCGISDVADEMSVFAKVPGRGDEPVGDAVLLVASMPRRVGSVGRGVDNATVPHPLFIMLALAAELMRAPWLGADMLILLIPYVPKGSDGLLDVRAGVECFTRAHTVDGWGSGRGAHTESSGIPVLRLRPRALVHQLRRALSGLHDGAPTPPWYPALPRTQYAGIRAAIVVEPRRRRSNGEVGSGGNGVMIDISGPRGALPELDFVAVIGSAFGIAGLPRPVLHLVGTRGDGSIHEAFTALRQWMITSGAVRNVLPFVRHAVASVGLDSLIGGADDAASVGAYVNSAETMVRFAARWLLSNAGSEHGRLLDAGIQAVTLTCGECGAAPRGLRNAAAALAKTQSLGAALEAAARSLASIEERLHASASSYLLISGDTFTDLVELGAAIGVSNIALLASLLLTGTRLDLHQGTLAAVAAGIAVLCGDAIVATAVDMRVIDFDLASPRLHWQHHSVPSLATVTIALASVVALITVLKLFQRAAHRAKPVLAVDNRSSVASIATDSAPRFVADTSHAAAAGVQLESQSSCPNRCCRRVRPPLKHDALRPIVTPRPSPSDAYALIFSAWLLVGAGELKAVYSLLPLAHIAAAVLIPALTCASQLVHRPRDGGASPSLRRRCGAALALVISVAAAATSLTLAQAASSTYNAAILAEWAATSAVPACLLASAALLHTALST